jgi:hypothetical protein
MPVPILEEKSSLKDDSQRRLEGDASFFGDSLKPSPEQVLGNGTESAVHIGVLPGIFRASVSPAPTSEEENAKTPVQETFKVVPIAGLNRVPETRFRPVDNREALTDD